MCAQKTQLLLNHSINTVTNMTSNQPSSSAAAGSSSGQQEFIVRTPKNRSKKYSIMRFNASNKVDFTKYTQAKIARENNLKEYKTANDIDDVPKFGAGSEFGQEARDEARRKKWGQKVKRYNVEDQPWLLKLGSGKQAKKYKGTREGGISDNTSYYIFTQCPDGAFEAVPVEEWYNFIPSINYKYLNAEEAEEEFLRRDKTMNYFSVMLKKRVRNEEIDESELAKEVNMKKKNKDFMLTEMEDWADMSGDSDSDEDKKKNDDEDKEKKKKSKKKDRDTDDEAVEESDEGDFDDREVDYMSDTSKSDSDDEQREGKDKYGIKGVEDEEGLRTLNESEDEEEEKDKKKDEEDNIEKDNVKGSGSESSSSSDSDSDDPEKGEFSSALFMQKKKGTPGGSRSNTPTPGASEVDKGKKRKGETDSPVAKKLRTDSPAPVQKVKTETRTPTPTPSAGSLSEGITEDAVKRYLMRKPMTTKDLLQKFMSKKTGITNELLVTSIAQILKKLNPDKEMVKGKMYLSIKSKE